MRKTLVVTALLALSAAASSWAAENNEKKAADPPARFQQGVIEQGNLIAVDRDGRLISQNLMWGTQRDYGNLDRELVPFVDVRNDKACVMTADEVCEVALASGKVLRSAKHNVKTGALGWIDADRVFVHNGQTIEIIDLAKQQTMHTIDLSSEKGRKPYWLNGSPFIAHVRDKNLLYVAQSADSGIAVVDLKQGKLDNVFEVSHFGAITGLHLEGGQLFAREMSVSYGFLYERLHRIDLATGKTVGLPFPGRQKGERFKFFDRQTLHTGIFACDGGGFWLAAHQGVYRFNAEGKLVGQATDALSSGARLIGAGNDGPVISNAKTVVRFNTSAVKVVAN